MAKAPLTSLKLKKPPSVLTVNKRIIGTGHDMIKQKIASSVQIVASNKMNVLRIEVENGSLYTLEQIDDDIRQERRKYMMVLCHSSPNGDYTVLTKTFTAESEHEAKEEFHHLMICLWKNS